MLNNFLPVYLGCSLFYTYIDIFLGTTHVPRAIKSCVYLSCCFFDVPFVWWLEFLCFSIFYNFIMKSVWNFMTLFLLYILIHFFLNSCKFSIFLMPCNVKCLVKVEWIKKFLLYLYPFLLIRVVILLMLI